MRRILSTINHQLSTRRSVLILIAVGIAAFVLWPRPALELYTTPPLDSKGTRIQLLIPRGWHLAYSSTHTRSAYLYFTEKEPIWAWLPDIRERAAELHLNWDLSHSVKWLPDAVDENEAKDYYAQRTLHTTRNGLVSVIYQRTNRRGFRGTYRAILDSVKVL